MTHSQHRTERSDSADSTSAINCRRLDAAVTEALQRYGGLRDGEYPVLSVVVSETRGWNADGEEYVRLHVHATEGSSRRHAAKLLEDAGDLTTRVRLERS